MTREVVSWRTNESLHDIWAVMKKRGLKRIPMVDERQKPIGVIYARDALQNLLGEVADEETLLRDYVMDVGYQRPRWPRPPGRTLRLPTDIGGQA
mgnify:CR=1 FL=1